MEPKINLMHNLNLAVRPYDSSLADNLSMYDHLPYTRDDVLCDHESIRLYSGNIFKHYQYKTCEPYVILGT